VADALIEAEPHCACIGLSCVQERENARKHDFRKISTLLFEPVFLFPGVQSGKE
jgi:hypothetical protein